MKRNPLFFIPIVLLAFSILYGIEFFVFWTFYVIYKVDNYESIHYLIPLIAEIIIILSFGMKFLPCVIIYKIIYNISLIFLGIQLQMIPFMLLFHIINILYPLSKSSSLFIIIPLPLIISIYGLINPYLIKIDRIFLSYKGFNPFHSVRIVHLSDIHLGVQLQQEFCEKIVKIIKGINPDIVVITGDFSDGTMKVKGEWMEPFDTLTMPILYITGNHEQIHGKEEMLKEVAKTKIIHIGNECKEFCGIKFIGVDYEYDLKERLDYYKEMGEFDVGESKPLVLLNHVPKLKPEELKEYNIFLNLVGHTHGGQLMPLQIPAYFANACFNGLYSTENNSNHVYVSSGVGFANIPMRTFSRSVIGLITIEGQK